MHMCACVCVYACEVESLSMVCTYTACMNVLHTCAGVCAFFLHMFIW